MKRLMLHRIASSLYRFIAFVAQLCHQYTMSLIDYTNSSLCKQAVVGGTKR
jgi:hypothetical protein